MSRNLSQPLTCGLIYGMSLVQAPELQQFHDRSVEVVRASTPRLQIGQTVSGGPRVKAEQ